jgi:hypothetical protein
MLLLSCRLCFLWLMFMGVIPRPAFPAFSKTLLHFLNIALMSMIPVQSVRCTRQRTESVLCFATETIQVASLFMWQSSCFIVYCSLFMWQPSCFIVHCSLFMWQPSCFIVHCSLFMWQPSCFIVHVAKPRAAMQRKGGEQRQQSVMCLVYCLKPAIPFNKNDADSGLQQQQMGPALICW